MDRSIDGGLELQDVGDILIWYNNVNPERTVEIVNYMKNQVTSGEQIFYDIYTDEEKEEDPDKAQNYKASGADQRYSPALDEEPQ